MKKKICKECGQGTYRETTTEHLIKTRDERRKALSIENLPINECNICGHVELPERSEEVIQSIKHSVQMEMERIAEEDYKETKEINNINPFVTFIKRFIS